MVTPSNKNAELPGATVVEVAQLCPLRPVLHVLTTIDAGAFALALDALNNEGTASVQRLKPSILSVCFRIQAKGMDTTATDPSSLWKILVDGFL